MANYTEFAQKIKTKYPQYANVDDRELAQKMVEKYPQYRDKVNFEQSREPAGATRSWEQPMTQRITEAVYPSMSQMGTPQNVGQRAASAAMGTVDLLDLPKRAVASILGQGEMSDPEANVWAVPRQMWRDHIKQAQTDAKPDETTTSMTGMSGFGLGDVQYGTESKKESLDFQRKFEETIFEIVGDPLIAKAVVEQVMKTPFRAAMKKVVEAPRKIAGAAARGLTKIPEETLLKYADPKGKIDLAKAYNREVPTAKSLVRQVYFQKLPEEKLVQQFIDEANDIPIDRVVNSLEMAKNGIKFKKTNADAIKAIDNLITDFADQAGPGGLLPAKTYRDMRKELDNVLGDVYEKEGLSQAQFAFKEARKVMKEELVNAAPKQYKAIMDAYATRMNVMSEMKTVLGKDTGMPARKRARTMLEGIKRRTKTEEREILEAYDAEFGTNYTKRGETMAEARQIAAEPPPPGGEFQASLFPKVATGWGAFAAKAGLFIGWPRTSGKVLNAISKLEGATKAGYNIPAKIIKGIPLANEAAVAQALTSALKPMGRERLEKINKLLDEREKAKRESTRNLIDRNITKLLEGK